VFYPLRRRELVKARITWLALLAVGWVLAVVPFSG